MTPFQVGTDTSSSGQARVSVLCSTKLLEVLHQGLASSCASFSPLCTTSTHLTTPALLLRYSTASLARQNLAIHSIALCGGTSLQLLRLLQFL